MSDKHDLTGHEPQLSNNDKSGMEPQLGGEQRQQQVAPLLLRFIAQVSGETGMIYKLEDVRSRLALVQLRTVGDQSLAPLKQSFLVRGVHYEFESTGLSARLDGPQTRWHIDYVKSLSSPSRLEWVLRDDQGLPLGIMRLNKPLGWLEIDLADGRRVCKTTTAPHRGGIEGIIVHTDRLASNMEPLFLIALLFGLTMGAEFPRPGC